MRKTGGVGMGLALVRRIVAAYGGEVRSEVGQGTKVNVRLPRTVRPAAGGESREHFGTSDVDFADTVAP